MLSREALTQSSMSTSHVEVIWAMGLASLAGNNNELILPQHMAEGLTHEAIEDLKLRLR